ncbi:hypothetical protein ACHAXH_001335 [Discostella pseudostelligera]
MTDATTSIQTLPLLFHGTLLNTQGITIPNAKIQLWQTDLDGNYLFPDSTSAATNPQLSEHADMVSNFQYYGTDSTDQNGHFEFLTYRPGIYTMRPYSHFHFMVWLDEDDPTMGDEPSLVTQFYFRDEAPPFPEVLQLDVTEVDSSRYNYGSYVNSTIVVEEGDGSATTLEASPTQPQGPFYPTTDFFSASNDLTRALTTTQDASGEFPTTPFPTLEPLESPSPSAPGTSMAGGVPKTYSPTPADTVEEGDADSTKYPTTPFPTLDSYAPSTGYPVTSFPTEKTTSAESKAQTTSVPSLVAPPTLKPVVTPGAVSNDGVASIWFGRYSAALYVSVSFAVLQYCIL